VLSLVPSHHNHAIGENIGIRLDVDHVVVSRRGSLHDPLAGSRAHPFRRSKPRCAAPTACSAPALDLSPARLLEAYRHGIFPWYSEGEPILWWSPDPRMVLVPDEVRMSRSMLKDAARGRTKCARHGLRRGHPRAAAAAPGQAGTWISEEMRRLCALHELGHAHCVETWIDGDWRADCTAWRSVACLLRRVDVLALTRRLEDRPRPPGALS
jgi:hypothetical protein